MLSERAKKTKNLLKELIRAVEVPPRGQKDLTTVMDNSLLFSNAFWSLRSATAVRVYLTFLTKRSMKKVQARPGRRDKEWRCLNNGEIEFCYGEAGGYGIDGRSFCKAIDELIRVGLIDITSQGSGLHKDKSKYSISERWKKYGTPEFEVRVRQKRRCHWGFAKGNQYGKGQHHKSRIFQHTKDTLEQVSKDTPEGNNEP